MKCSPGISNFLEEITSLSHSIDFLYFFALRAGFILGGSKIIADGDCSHEIKRRLLLGRKVITNLDSILKSRGEKERYTHLNSEFQRIARRDKKAFLSDQCKEIEEINRMGKTRDLFKKIRDTKGTFHAKMVSIKDRNVINLTEAEYI